jgi:G patch domain/KOW motif-containing protein
MDEERKPNGEDRMDTEDATPAAANGAEEKQGEGEAQTSTATPVKIGFSFGGLAAGKRKVSIQGTKKEEGEEGRELVTAIQGSKMKTLFEKDDGPLVIPLPQPLRSKKAKIEGEEKPTSAPAVVDPKLAGLSAEDREAAEALIKEGKEGIQVEPEEEDMPLLLKYRLPGLDTIEDEDEKFRFDVESRPEETTASAYDRVPVEKFGEAMLRGMLWKPGDPIGNTNKAVVKPVEFIARHHRLGLGAAPKAPEPTKKKFIKPGESREPKQMMVLPRDKDGRQRHVRDLDQKLVAFRPEGIHPGNLVGVVSGEHEGMYARIVQLLAGDKVRIRFESEEEVTVNRIDLAPLNSTQLKQGHPALGIRDGGDDGDVEEEDAEDDGDDDDGEDDDDHHKAAGGEKGVEWEQETTNTIDGKSGGSAGKSSARDDAKRSSGGGGGSTKRREEEKKEKKEKKMKREEKRKEPVWLRPGITVRIVSKSLGEKYYRKKVKVVDVVAGDICTIMLDSGRILENIRQRQVETVIPDVGRRVVVVLGRDRGKVGKLLQKSTSKETAVVQFEGDWAGEVGTYGLDDISEYRGEH